MIPHERSLVESMKDRPFAMLGVLYDHDLRRARPILDQLGVNYPNFWNREGGRSGHLSSLWNVHRWPTRFVMDHKGVIRAIDLQYDDLFEIVEDLVAEAEADAAGSSKEKPDAE